MGEIWKRIDFSKLELGIRGELTYYITSIYK